MLDQVFVDVVGGDRHGRVQTMGIVAVPPSSKSRTSYSQASQSNFEARIRAEYEERFNDLQTNLQQQISDPQRQIAELMTLCVLKMLHLQDFIRQFLLLLLVSAKSDLFTKL
ncbi:hypothetical protein CFOL_v3_08179 [Cephalotus follicularis]|uniref:Uncharacterized protein n=1 Tax=Cephalotus follicularis TaxID=3775 RepID=A0A1Q3B9G1_CEPFO|nr:hypothetical protein CFOL_v3_08179 [Cephalotus follicularis]